MNFRTVSDLYSSVCRGARILPADIDVIVGIPRSGLLAANMLALHLNRPLADIDGFLSGRVISCGRRLESFQDSKQLNLPSKVLIVDDSVYSGAAIREARERLRELSSAVQIFYCAVYVTPGLEGVVDFAFEACALPRFFEWNFMHHSHLESACVDIDGVLCLDPTPEQNDDGPKYLEFLKTAVPLHRPTVRIKKLVTCRLEKYREHTIQWLGSNQIEFDELVMMDFPTKDDRIRSGSHGKFKGLIYRNCSSRIFIESDFRQALEIADVSRKPVFCLESSSTVFPSAMSIASGTVQRTKRVLKRRARAAQSRIGSWILRRLNT